MYSRRIMVKFSDIDEEITEISVAKSYYLTPSGKVYHFINGKYYSFKSYKNPRNGYMYISPIVNGKHKSFRLHRLIAEAYIPNPNNYPVVGHYNNIKDDICVLNLYWTTYSENTQKAFLDGLIINDKGFDDSQSISVKAFDKDMKFICDCGSITEASKKFNVSKSTVARHIFGKIQGKSRCGLYFRKL